ncbi:MAG: MoaD/ThiS family protein [Leptospirillia bacterium]
MADKSQVSPRDFRQTLTIINHQTGTTLEIPAVRTVQALLKKLDLPPETVLVIQDDTLLCDDDPLNPDSPVEVRPVISGGSLP